MFGIFDDKLGVRILSAAADGRVIPIGELGDGVYSRRGAGDGYAVIPSSGIIRAKRDIILYSPADGVVSMISEQDGLSLRTGDGITLSVVFRGGNVFTELGARLSAGEPFCRLPRAGTLINGGVPVLICDPDRITELHIKSGRRRHGSAAAFYRVSE
ncbi:MAG: PTS glucose transporter subunit IIA [Oscillospiraceae bacterium]